MAKCAFCNSTILFGGLTNGADRYCNQKCQGMAMLATAADAVPPDVLEKAVRDVHAGKCPECGGSGPIDVHTSYFVWSALVLTGWSNTPGVSCRGCAVKRQAGAAVGSAIVGWWGFPWGLVMTPVQVGRNIAAMTGGKGLPGPSPQLAQMVRMRLGAQLIAAERARQQAAAAPPTAPGSRSPR